jgi:hypothetical protein
MALDRSGLIEQLQRLGADNDATVLEAARAIHRKALESGLSWDDLIRPDGPGRKEWSPEETGEGQIEGKPVPDPDAAEIGRLIDRLIRKGVSDSLRQDLTEMRRELNGGTLDPQDARYVRALARRLGV